MTSKIVFKKLPFSPDEHDVFFVESSYDLFINSLISTNYHVICDLFRQYGFRFVYMPKLQENLNVDVIRYFAPYVSSPLLPPLTSKWLLQYVADAACRLVKPSLLYHSRKFHDVTTAGAHVFHAIPIGKGLRNVNGLEQLLRAIKKDIEESGDTIRQSTLTERPDINKRISSIVEDETIEVADKSFYAESRQLLQEVREKVDRLRQMGVSRAVLSQLLQPEEKLSRLVVTQEGDIVLPDYNNMQIAMRPLVKAVYLLFLRHEKGILFKYLPDYAEELTAIYRHLRKGNLSDRARKSIEDVCNPLNNSINEKCARIREAFVSRFDEHLACHYYVNGNRGEEKKIALPRDLVKWEWMFTAL